MFRWESSVVLARIFIGFLLLLALALVLCIPRCFVHVITPTEMTYTRIDVTRVRIHRYGMKNHAIPETLEDLSSFPGYPTFITDGWGYLLQYDVDDNGVMTLVSMGADGQVGGEGLDADISISYYTRKEDGSLWIDDESWIIDAEIR